MTAVTPYAVRQLRLFSDLSRKELKRLATVLNERSFPAGSTVTEEGEGGVGFFVIKEGRARVLVGGRSFGEIGTGDHFGDVALITEQARTATVIAITELRCYGMPSWEFRQLVEENPAFSWRVLESTTEKLLAAQRDQRLGGADTSQMPW